MTNNMKLSFGFTDMLPQPWDFWVPVLMLIHFAMLLMWIVLTLKSMWCPSRDPSLNPITQVPPRYDPRKDD